MTLRITAVHAIGSIATFGLRLMATVETACATVPAAASTSPRRGPPAEGPTITKMPRRATQLATRVAVERRSLSHTLAMAAVIKGRAEGIMKALAMLVCWNAAGNRTMAAEIETVTITPSKPVFNMVAGRAEPNRNHA